MLPPFAVHTTNKWSSHLLRARDRRPNITVANYFYDMATSNTKCSLTSWSNCKKKELDWKEKMRIKRRENKFNHWCPSVLSTCSKNCIFVFSLLVTSYILRKDFEKVLSVNSGQWYFFLAGLLLLEFFEVGACTPLEKSEEKHVVEQTRWAVTQNNLPCLRHRWFSQQQPDVTSLAANSPSLTHWCVQVHEIAHDTEKEWAWDQQPWTGWSRGRQLSSSWRCEHEVPAAICSPKSFYILLKERRWAVCVLNAKRKFPVTCWRSLKSGLL